MRSAPWLVGLALGAWASLASTQEPGSAALLLPACRVYVQSADRGERLRLERGVCLGTIETVLRLQQQLRAAYQFCLPQQVTLLTAVETVVSFADGRRDLDQPLHALAIEAFQQEWPCEPSS